MQPTARYCSAPSRIKMTGTPLGPALGESTWEHTIQLRKHVAFDLLRSLQKLPLDCARRTRGQVEIIGTEAARAAEIFRRLPLRKACQPRRLEPGGDLVGLLDGAGELFR